MEHFNRKNMKVLKNTLKSLFKLFIILFLTSCSSQIRIIYEPIGIMDKPLPTIEIGQIVDNKEEVSSFVTNKRIVNRLVNHIESSLTKELSEENELGYDYGAYKITVLKDDNKTVYILSSQRASYDFFKNQMELVGADSGIYKELETLIKRLK